MSKDKVQHIDTIGDMVVRKWDWVIVKVECDHCGKETDVKLSLNETSRKYINKLLDDDKKQNTLSEEIIKSNDNIPTSEIEQDIADTQQEIDDYQDERKILMRKPQENKVRLYMLEERISKRQDFINKLNEILDYRRKSK